MCGRRFRQASGLTQHKLVHSDVRKYPCKNCELRFKTKFSLKVHQNAKHENRIKEKFKCEICGKVFLIQKPLRRHLWLKHKKDEYAAEFDN